MRTNCSIQKCLQEVFALTPQSEKNGKCRIHPHGLSIKLVKMIFTNNKKILAKSSKPIFAYAQIIFFGPLYSIVNRYRKKIKLRLHLSGDCYVPVPAGLIARIFKKRLVMFGEQQQLKSFIRGIVKLRKSNIYTGTGIRLRAAGYKRKPGKIRRR